LRKNVQYIKCEEEYLMNRDYRADGKEKDCDKTVFKGNRL
jgi:hypothetical protein